VGAGSTAALARVPAPARLVARYGTEAPAVLAGNGGTDEVAAGVTEAELRWGVRHEGALDEGDLLDRRTRIGLVRSDRDRALAAARRALRTPPAPPAPHAPHAPPAPHALQANPPGGTKSVRRERES
jgi:glycerol-3-phosphate dehydrogenase